MQNCSIDKNMGLADRIIRTGAASSIIGLCASKKLSAPLKTGLLVFSGILLATSFIGSCPAYTPFGISTRSEDGSF